MHGSVSCTDLFLYEQVEHLLAELRHHAIDGQINSFHLVFLLHRLLLIFLALLPFLKVNTVPSQQDKMHIITHTTKQNREAEINSSI
jgi:hypothetical protein